MKKRKKFELPLWRRSRRDEVLQVLATGEPVLLRRGTSVIDGSSLRVVHETRWSSAVHAIFDFSFYLFECTFDETRRFRIYKKYSLVFISQRENSPMGALGTKSLVQSVGLRDSKSLFWLKVHFVRRWRKLLFHFFLTLRIWSILGEYLHQAWI